MPMIGIPDPLHPAVAHFPIAFLIVGAAVSLLTLFTQKWNLLWFAAGLLTIGALGSIAGVITGERAEKAAGELPPIVEHHLDEHEDWAKRTRLIAAIAALLAILSASLGRFPKLSWPVSLLATLSALLAAFCVYETGHSGAKLVYDFGIGVNTNVAAPTTEATAVASAETSKGISSETQKGENTETTNHLGCED